METRALTQLIFMFFAAGGGIFLLCSLVARYTDESCKRPRPNTSEFDPVDEASRESFPASDAPAW